jgi:hypothetical protein
LFFLFYFLGILQSALSHCEDQTATERVQQREQKLLPPNVGEMAGMSAKMERVNGLLLLFQFVLLVSCLATVSTTRENCYNGPAPVIVNNEADVYLGTYYSIICVWPCSGFRVANHTAPTSINHTVGDGAKSPKASDRNGLIFHESFLTSVQRQWVLFPLSPRTKK